MYRSEHNFKRANEFIPQRWMSGDESLEFESDRRDCFHPFSYGPRTCLAVKYAPFHFHFQLGRKIIANLPDTS
jgi:cytochrome P450